jgi:hypothetical protein
MSRRIDFTRRGLGILQGCIKRLDFSLSSIGWRRGLGRGGALLLVSPLLSPLPTRSSRGEDGELDAALGILLASLFILTGGVISPAKASESKEKPAKFDESIFTNRAVPRIQITISDEGMATLRRYHWKWGGNDSERVQVRATVKEGAAVYTNVAVHLKGAAGSFRPVDDKPGLTLNFGKFAPGQRFHGMQKISLNNSVQDPSYLTDQLCRELFEAGGVPAPRAGHAIVELNERELGPYVMTEGWDKQFLKRHFHNTKGNLYDGGFVGDIKRKLAVNSGEHPADQSDLAALVSAAQEPDLTRRPGRLEKLLDLDRFLTFMALDVMLWNWDSYTINVNNYRVYHDLDADRIMFLPHGMDQMFWKPAAPIVPGMKGLVAKAVIQIPEYRRRYLERFAQLRTNVFQLQAVTNRVNELAAKVRPAVVQRGLLALASFEQGLAVLRERIVQRARSIDEQLAGIRNLIKFDEAGSVLLSGWQSKVHAGHPAFAQAGNRLQISGNEAGTTGSWRTTVWLGRGRYRIEGKVKVWGVVADSGDPRAGVGFRVFSRRKLSNGSDWEWFPFKESQDLQLRGELPQIGESTARLSGDSDWIAVHYDFDLRQPVADLDIYCELRAAKGEAWFEVPSLKLIRK